MKKNLRRSIKVASILVVASIVFSCNLNTTPNSVVDKSNVIGNINQKSDLQWHHVEDLDTMILVPDEIHFGGSSLLNGLKLFRANWDALIALGYE